MKIIKEKNLHIAVIILGIIFVTIPIFHNNLWFDEAYTVGMVKNSFYDIWRIGSNDVHPVLYYWILHLVYLVFGSNIYVYRIISVIPLAILGILGYTHIKKDFGEKVGILFSFYTFFLPVTTVYAGEIRMYTWAMLFVTLMAIYAYRIYKNSTIKNWIIFAIFSLASAYTHYYALVTAGIVNLILFIYLIYKSIKSHKENKIYSKELKYFIISAITQILLYLPWIVFLLAQTKGVSDGYWIKRPSIEIFSQIYIFQFVGNLDATFINNNIAIIFGSILMLYTIYEMIICKEKKVGILAIGIYLTVFLIIYIISLKMPILYARYFLNLTGLFIFFLVFFMAKEKRNIITLALCFITLLMAILVNINVIKMNYAQNNKQAVEYIKQDFREGDIVIWGNEGNGFTISMQLGENIPTYFYDKEYWNKEAAYEVFGKNMTTIKTLEPLNDYKGRIWIINGDDYKTYDQILEEYGQKIKIIKQNKIHTDYHAYNYSITLVEKDL